MSLRTRRHVVAFGLSLAVALCGVVGLAQDASPNVGVGRTPNQRATEQAQTPEPPAPPATEGEPAYTANYERACTEPRNAGEADLCQQWRSANSAERAVELARAQIQWSQREFATLIAALLFTAAATIAAAMAVRAARQANRVAREVGRDQARAYVDLEWVLVELNGQRVRDVGAKLTNTGQTPAVWANVHADFRVVDASQNVEDPTIDKDAAGMDWGPVPAGGHSTVGIERDGMRLAIAKVFGAKGILTFEVFGRVRYGTIFDETYETEFSLHHNDLYNRTVMVEGDVPLLDQPCKLYRAPARRVVYKRLSGPQSD